MTAKLLSIEEMETIAARSPIFREILYGRTRAAKNDGYTIDPVYGKINIKQALQDRAKAIEDEYEAFDRMHTADGTFAKCPFKL